MSGSSANAVDGQDGGDDYYRGTSWYARTVGRSELPDADRCYLEVPGANASADVYLNGRLLAHHDGFFLNGERYPLHGVSRHQDRRDIGNALLPEHHREDMELNDLCHRLDPTRLTAVAAVSMCPTDSPYLDIPDVVSYNL